MSDPIMKSRHNRDQHLYALAYLESIVGQKNFYIGEGRYRVDRLSADEVIVSLPEGNVRGPWLSNEDCQSEIRDISVIQLELHKYISHIFEDSLKNLFVPQWPVQTVMSYSVADYFIEEGQDEDLPCPAFEIKSQKTPQDLAEAILSSDSALASADLQDLILAAEDADFSREISSKLSPWLLDFAMQHRDSNDADLVPVVLSAIRAGASMTEPMEIRRLRPLLEPGHSIETSLVALKMLGRVFEAQAPAEVDLFQDLVAEVSGIAESFLNRYAISIPQSAAMANLAIFAIASMASNELIAYAERVRSLDVLWFTQRVARELSRLRDSWRSKAGRTSHRTLGLLNRAITVLSSE